MIHTVLVQFVTKYDKNHILGWAKAHKNKAFSKRLKIKQNTAKIEAEF